MEDSGACDVIRPQLGVYLTGAIAPADRAIVVRHLAGCEDCRAELAGLAGLPGLLRRPDVQAAAESACEESAEANGAEEPQAGESLLRRLLNRVARGR